MSGSLLEICDQFITRCNQVLAAKDNEAAKRLRTDATRRFYSLIPRWSAGLMASITDFYLDDVENILVKLIDFRKQLEKASQHDRGISQEIEKSVLQTFWRIV